MHRLNCVAVAEGPDGLVNRIEDSIDDLEQAAFVASLMPEGLAAELIDPLIELCAAVVP